MFLYFPRSDNIGLLKRQPDADPHILSHSNWMTLAGSSVLRCVLVAMFCNEYANSPLILFVDIFLLFVFAELHDEFVRRVRKPYIDAVKNENAEFDEMYAKYNNQVPAFMFQKMENGEVPSLSLDSDGRLYPASVTGNIKQWTIS